MIQSRVVVRGGFYCRQICRVVFVALSNFLVFSVLSGGGAFISTSHVCSLLAAGKNCRVL